MFKQFTLPQLSLAQLSLILLLATTSTNLHAMQAQAVLEKIKPEVVEKNETQTEEPRFSKADKALLTAGITSGAAAIISFPYWKKINTFLNSRKASRITYFLGATGVIAASTTAAVKDFDKTKKLTEQKKSVYIGGFIGVTTTAITLYIARVLAKNIARSASRSQ